MTFASRPLEKLQTTWGLSFCLEQSRAEQSELLPLDVCAEQAEQLLGLFREAVPVRSLETSVPEFARVHAIVLCRLSSGFVKVLLIGFYVFSGNPLAPARFFWRTGGARGCRRGLPFSWDFSLKILRGARDCGASRIAGIASS